MACIGGTMSTWELCTHVMRPIYAPSTQTGGLSENGMRWWNDEHMGIYTPSTHTGGLSENGMRWWNDEHMGIYAPSTQTGGLSENGMH